MKAQMEPETIEIPMTDSTKNRPMPLRTRPDKASIKTAPYSARAVANFFLQRAWREGVSITAKRIQKLVGLAHAYSLKARHVPLIQDEIVPSEFGPIIPSLLTGFQRFGDGEIWQLATEKGKAPQVTPSDVSTVEFLNTVWDVLKGKSDIQLLGLARDIGFSARSGGRKSQVLRSWSKAQNPIRFFLKRMFSFI